MRALLFGKVPAAGAVKTRLTPALGAERAARLQEAMAADVLAGCRAAGFERTWVLSGDLSHRWVGELRAAGERVLPQGEGDLGQRLRLGFEAAGTPAVALGLDAPTLPPELLVELAACQTDLALGPAFDGGYWGLALRRPAPELFSGIRWSDPATLRDTVARARALGLSLDLAPFWYDVDELADLELLENHLAVLPEERASNTRRVLCP